MPRPAALPGSNGRAGALAWHHVTAVHSHMLDEEPRLFFMHFRANDDAVSLARGLRAALDQTASKKRAARS
jgi:hypothetical protein